MKTTTIKLCLLLTIFILNLGQIAYAVDPATVNIDELINRPVDKATGQVKTGTSEEQEQITKLPEVDAPQLLTTVIKYILRLAAILTMIALIITAIYYLISMGKEEDISKARNILIYLIIGIVIIAGSYGVVTGLSQFDFFTEPAQ